MADKLMWFTAVLAVVVLIQSIWVVLLTLKAHRRMKKLLKGNVRYSFALISLPAAFVPAMWTLCIVLFLEMMLLTYVLVDFYVADSAVRLHDASFREQP